MEIYAICQIFNITINSYESDKNFKYHRFLYKHNNDSEIFQYCMILNHTYTEHNAEHYELLIVNQHTFDIKYLNSEDYVKNNLPKNINEINLINNIDNNRMILKDKNKNYNNAEIIKIKKETKININNNSFDLSNVTNPIINKDNKENNNINEYTNEYNTNNNVNISSINVEYLKHISENNSLNNNSEINVINNEDFTLEEFNNVHLELKKLILDNNLDSNDKIIKLKDLCFG